MTADFFTNQRVITPAGPGTVQGKFINGKWIVRLSVSKETRGLHTLTPRAEKSGLYLFKGEELK